MRYRMGEGRARGVGSPACRVRGGEHTVRREEVDGQGRTAASWRIVGDILELELSWTIDHEFFDTDHHVVHVAYLYCQLICAERLDCVPFSAFQELCRHCEMSTRRL